MKKVIRSSQVLTIVLVILALSSVFFGVEMAWATDGPTPLSLSMVEDVDILGSGTATVKLLINVADSPLADMYRQLLAAPYGASVGEEMPIPENKTGNGGEAPVRQEYYRSIKQEQMASFGFGMRISNSTMVPRDEQNGCKVSIDALASAQVANVADLGSDVIFEIIVGPKDENATGAAFGLLLTKVAYAQQMLASLEGEQVYESEWTVRIKVPTEALLLNGNELDGLSWAVNFGGGTSMNAFMHLDGASTIVLSERTMITEQNATATPMEIFEAFRSYRVFTIKYQLPKSALAEGEELWTSAEDRDWSYSWSWSLSFSVPFPFVIVYPIGDAYAKIEGTLTVTPTFSFSGYIGWDFDWDPWPELDWFKAWIGVGASLRVDLDATVTLSIEHTWERTLYQQTLFRFEFSICGVPVWADLDFSIIARLTVGASGSVHITTGCLIGASLKVGTQYDGGWSPIHESNLYASGYGPEFSAWKIEAHAEAALMARLSLLIYGSAGPYIEFGPYLRGHIEYIVDDEVAPWEIVAGLQLNVGITFKGFISDLLGLDDYSYNLGDWPIKRWAGHFGQARSDISVNLNPASTYKGSATMVTGAISSPYEGNKGGIVHIEYSTNNADWIEAGSIASRADGGYSFFWYLGEAGAFYVRSRWNGNSGYKAAQSASVNLDVSSVVTGSQYIPPYYDDVQIVMYDQYCPMQDWAAAVRFTPPTTPWKLDKFIIYGMYIDNSYVTLYFHARVWDSNLNNLWQGDYPMSECFPVYTGEAAGDWKVIDIDPDIVVSGDFYIVVWGDRYAQQYGGGHLEIGEDLTLPGSGHSYYASALWGNSVDGFAPDWAIATAGFSLFEDHYMYAMRWVQIGNWHVQLPVKTNTFYVTDDSAYSKVKFNTQFLPPNWPTVPYGSVTWKWYQPNAKLPFLTDTFYYDPEAWDGFAETILPIESWPSLYEQYLGRPFKVDIYWNGILALTETFIVIKYGSSILLTIPSDSITYGQSIQISSQTYPFFSDGTTALQYSIDDIHWNNIATGVPSNGYYSYNWVPPHAGNYSIRAVWSGNANYANATSETKNLTVTQAPTSLSTSLSSTTIIVGPNVTITASLTSAITGAPLQGKGVTLQFRSVASSTWYTLGTNTTDSTGQCTYDWAPDVGVYYIRFTWYGDDDYLGCNGTTEQLTVEPSRSTTIEIVNGANAEVDRTSSTVEFGVMVIDTETGQPLKNIGRVQFYVSDQSYFNNILIGGDTDTDGDGIYHIQWNTGNWPVLGPQPWTAYFEGTPEYMPSSASSTFTIYYTGVALWIDPTFQPVIITSSTTYTINFKWNRDTADVFALSINGLDPSWYTLSQTAITLSYKGQTEQVTLTISPPNAPTILTDYEFTVTATSQTTPSFSASATATIRVEFTPTLPPSPTGGLAIIVQPQVFYTSAGTKIIINILVINNQNFDDAITTDIRNTGILPEYQASLTWFNWLRAKVFLPAGASIYIPLEIEVPSDTPLDTYYFRAVATSTANFAITAEDSGTIILAETIPPITTITLAGASGLNGWYVSDVTVTFAATDDLSGVASTEYSFDGTNWIPYTGPITISAEGTTTIYYRAIDNAGNIEGTKNQAIMIDKTPPSISGAATTSPNAYGWYRTDVTVHFTATDSLSGVDFVTADQIIAIEGAGQSVTGTAIDMAGNVASFTVLGINIDKTPPSISGAPTTSPNIQGWYKTDVVIHFEASDLLSGIETLTPDITLSAEGAGQYATGTAVDNAGNEASYTVYGINIDKTAPTTSLTIGEPKYISDKTYVTSDTPFTLEATDTGSGVYDIAYRIYNAAYDSGWQTYAAPFKLTSLTDGTYIIEYKSTDNADNAETPRTVSVTLDNSGPSIAIENPPPGCALQDGVTFIASTSDSSGTQSLNFSIREANGGEGIPVGFENMPATYNATTGKWELSFDTLQLPDGYYIVLLSAEDNLGHTASITVPYSIRNWAVLELLPATSNNKAGRTMPVKFALRVAAAVDPTQPFVYNEELTIKMYATNNPSELLQTSTFGDTSRDYRINTFIEQYIANFQTLKTPKTYQVEIWRKNMLIASFQFKTVT